MEYELDYKLAQYQCTKGHTECLPIGIRYREKGAHSWKFPILAFKCGQCNSQIHPRDFGSHEDPAATYRYLDMTPTMKENWDFTLLQKLEHGATPDFMLGRIETLEEAMASLKNQIENLKVCKQGVKHLELLQEKMKQ